MTLTNWIIAAAIVGGLCLAAAIAPGFIMGLLH